MAKVDVFSFEQKKVGDIELNDDVFGAKVNTALFYEVVKAQLASRRRGTHKSLTKAEVRGGGKKPWKQKHTGRARSGSIRNPHWVGGGTAFGPKPRDYSYQPPKKMRKGALRSALSLRLKENMLTVIDGFKIDTPKTKQIEAFLAKFGQESALIVDVENQNLMLSTRNLATAKFLPNVGLNVYDVLRYKHLFLTREAVAKVTGVLAK